MLLQIITNVCMHTMHISGINYFYCTTNVFWWPMANTANLHQIQWCKDRNTHL